MGGSQSVRGIYWMETIFPPPDGRSVIPPEKLQKEIAKGTIKAPDPNAAQSLDGDMDAQIDQVVKDVWANYDPKNTGVMKKSTMQQFFKDSLELYAMRVGKKSTKEVLAPGVNMTAAMAESVGKITPNEQATFKEFEDFLNCYDIDEALGSFLNVQEVQVQPNVQLVDTTQFVQAQAAPTKVKYRDYSGLQD